jgi:peptidyl-tRNA hydrolase
MEAGKAASQAGHAFLGSFLASLNSDTIYKEQAQEYAKEDPGTKVCLFGSLKDIEETKAFVDAMGVPNNLVVDSGCPDFYGGEPTITALGVGPLTKQQAKKLKLNKFKLL